MSEGAMREVERVLLHVSDASARTLKAIVTLERHRTTRRPLSVLQRTADDLLAVDRRLRQATFYATPAPAAPPD